MSAYDHVSVFAACCIGRTDDHTQQLPDGNYVRAGRPIDFDLIRQHLIGEITLGTYVVSEWNLCNFAVFDHDSPDPQIGLSVLLGIQSALSVSGIVSHLERSRRGGHLWVFCEPTPPALLRAWLRPYCPADPKLEFYPKQDTLSVASPYGACIRVPLGIHRLTGERYRFVRRSASGQLVDLFSSWSSAYAFFADVYAHRNIPPATLQVPQPTPPQTDFSLYPSKKPTGTNLSEVQQKGIAEWCLAQDPVAVIGRYVDLDAHGCGCCPFGSHHSDGTDSHPSFFVYRPAAPRIGCWYCHTWEQGGSLFDFFKLYYGLSARDLWVSIQQGMRL